MSKCHYIDIIMHINNILGRIWAWSSPSPFEGQGFLTLKRFDESKCFWNFARIKRTKKLNTNMKWSIKHYPSLSLGYLHKCDYQDTFQGENTNTFNLLNSPKTHLPPPRCGQIYGLDFLVPLLVQFLSVLFLNDSGLWFL